jgi:hypothetical protein
LIALDIQGDANVVQNDAKTNQLDNIVIMVYILDTMDTEQDQKILCQAELPIKQLAFALLKENGLTNTEASKAVGYSQGTGRVVSSKINKLSLIHPKIVKLAHKAIEDTLLMKPLEIEKTSIDKETGVSVPYTEKIYPSHAVRLQAAGDVYDRYQPKVTKVESQNLNVNLQVDYSEFLQGCK